VQKEYRYNLKKTFFPFIIFTVGEICVLLMIISLFKNQPFNGINTPIYAGMFFAFFAYVWSEYNFVNSVLSIDDNGITLKTSKSVKIYWPYVSKIKYKQGIKVLFVAEADLYSDDGSKIIISSMLKDFNEVLKIVYREVTNNNPQAQIDDSFKTLIEKIS